MKHGIVVSHKDLTASWSSDSTTSTYYSQDLSSLLSSISLSCSPISNPTITPLPNGFLITFPDQEEKVVLLYSDLANLLMDEKNTKNLPEDGLVRRTGMELRRIALEE